MCGCLLYGFNFIKRVLLVFRLPLSKASNVVFRLPLDKTSKPRPPHLRLNHQILPARIQIPITRIDGVDLERFGQAGGGEIELNLRFDFAGGRVGQRAFVEHAPVGNRADGFERGVQAVVFGGKCANGHAIAAGERVET